MWKYSVSPRKPMKQSGKMKTFWQEYLPSHIPPSVRYFILTTLVVVCVDETFSI